MKVLRIALSVVSLAALALGYAASQWAYRAGDPSSYAARVDAPPVRMLAFGLLVLALVLGSIPDRTADEETP